MEKKISRQAAAAKMIRQYMKENGIAGSVRSQGYSMGSSINVNVQDLNPMQYEALNSFGRQFEYGSFNGMEDIYEYNNVNDNIPQVSYVFVNNKMSDELGQSIYDFIKGRYVGMEDAPVSYKDSGNFYNKSFNDYASRLVYRLFSGGYNSNQYYESIGVIAVEQEAA
jgi:hypothetical protein